MNQNANEMSRNLFAIIKYQLKMYSLIDEHCQKFKVANFYHACMHICLKKKLSTS